MHLWESFLELVEANDSTFKSVKVFCQSQVETRKRREMGVLRRGSTEEEAEEEAGGSTDMVGRSRRLRSARGWSEKGVAATKTREDHHDEGISYSPVPDRRQPSLRRLRLSYARALCSTKAKKDGEIACWLKVEEVGDAKKKVQLSCPAEVVSSAVNTRSDL